jgi:NADH dehydrogenase FAD-containing subunit
METDATKKHVVIVGGGFAGLNCAKRLATNSRLRITLLDKNNYQQFQPLLYQVATGILSPEMQPSISGTYFFITKTLT